MKEFIKEQKGVRCYFCSFSQASCNFHNATFFSCDKYDRWRECLADDSPWYSLYGISFLRKLWQR